MGKQQPNISNSKRGRKPQHYRKADGSYVDGLARRPGDKRWRVIGTDITFVEPDEGLAIHKYLTLYADRSKPAPTIQPPTAAGRTPDEIRAAIEFMDQLKPAPPITPAFPPIVTIMQPPGATPLSLRTTGGDPIRVELSDDGKTLEFYGWKLAARAFWPWLRALILEHRQMVALNTGIEQIANLSDVARPAPSP